MSGEDAAAQWVQSRTPLETPVDSMVLPKLVDTPPAVFSARHVVDPFAPGRIEQSRNSEGVIRDGLEDRWRFADVPLDSLRVVGFLEVKGRYVAVLEGGSGFVNVKVGDRLSNQQAEILDISKQGIFLRQKDGSESWMPIARRSH